jgi:hypothetical protein
MWRNSTPWKRVDGVRVDLPGTKKPYTCWHDEGSSTDPGTWSDFETAINTLRKPGPPYSSGIGIALGEVSDGCYLAGIDLDSCLDDQGNLADWAAKFLARLDTYAEISPSGHGLKAFFNARASEAELRQIFPFSGESLGLKRTMDANGKDHGPAVELYFAGRFFTVTGRRWPDTPKTLTTLDREALAALAVLLPGGDSRQAPPSRDAEPVLEPVDSDALQRRLREALQRSPKLRVRWQGSTDGLHDTSRSAFDMSLGAMLKHQGFSFSEMRALLIQNPHGAGAENIANDRYFKRIWQNTHPAASQGDTPLYDPWEALPAIRFPRALLPERLHRFVDNRSQVIGAGYGGLAWATLAACGAAIDGRARLYLKAHDTWTAPARFWLGLVGPVSAKKTPTLKAAFEPLERVDQRASKAYQRRLKEWERLPAGERADEPEKPRRFLTHNATVEGIRDILAEQDSGITLFTDELAAFIGGLEKYNQGRGPHADRAFYLGAFQGGPFSAVRAGGKQIAVDNLLVGIAGGIQPDRLREFPDLTDDGLFQRFCPIIVGQGSLGGDLPSHEVLNDYKELLKELHRMRHLEFELTSRAYLVREDVEQMVFDLQADEPLGSVFAGFCGKVTDMWARICLIMHCIEDPRSSVVGQEIAQRALALIKESLLPNAVRVYMALRGGGPDIVATQDIAGYILAKRKDRVVRSELVSNVWSCRGQSVEKIHKLLSPLVAGDWLTPYDGDPDPKGWEVNPKVHEQFAAKAKQEAARREQLRELVRAAAADKRALRERGRCPPD